MRQEKYTADKQGNQEKLAINKMAERFNDSEIPLLIFNFLLIRK